MITTVDRRRFSFHKYTLAFPVIMGMLFSINTNAYSEHLFTLNNTNKPPYSTPENDGFVDLIITEAFRRTGHKVKLIIQPAERGLKNANAGAIDGDVTRIEGLEKKYPNLMRVPEKLFDWYFVAFSMDKNNADIAQIKQSSIAYIKGWKIYEQMFCCATNITPVEDDEQLFRLFDMGRVKYVLYEKYQGYAQLQKHSIQGARVVEPALATRQMYIYLNKQHAEIIPALSQALQTLKQEGFYDLIYKKTLAPYQQSASQ
jgi:polar amino acid transport system substrate-binding protein